MESIVQLPPAELARFLSRLSEKRPTLKPRLERGGDKLGNWWVDFSGRRELTVEWRPTFGFGLSYGRQTSFGEGPEEIFRTPERAADRVLQFLIATHEHAAGGLRCIRELYGVSQDQIAKRLKIKQAAISRLEGRTDPKIETVANFVRALGGQVEFRVVFPDGQMPIHFSKSSNLKFRSDESRSYHAKVKPARLARA